MLNREPYINHTLAITRICAEEIGLGKTAIISALLYPYVHEGAIKPKEVKALFGDQVSLIIKDLSTISEIDIKNTSEQAENFRKLLLSIVTDVRVILIKLAERLQVMRTLEAFPAILHFPLSTETFYLYAPLGHRLGLYKIKLELEDISLKYTDPVSYGQITRNLKNSCCT